MIGCTTLERHIVPASMQTPLSMLAGDPRAPHAANFADVFCDRFVDVPLDARFLYVDCSEERVMSKPVWDAIVHTLRMHRHVYLYVMDYRLDPGEGKHPGYQQIAMFPLKILEHDQPTYVTFAPDPDGLGDTIIPSMYSQRPVMARGL